MSQLQITTVDCEHATEEPSAHFVSCALKLYGGTPHTAVCNACPNRAAKSLRNDHNSTLTQTKVAIPVPASGQLARATARADACRRCMYNLGIDLQTATANQYTVKCKRAGGQPLSLINGSCRARRWDLATSKQKSEAGSSSEPIGEVSLPDFFGSIYVISLKRTPARLQQFWARLPSDWPFQMPAVFDAVDADRERAWHGWKGGGGAYGCWRSWMAILAQYLAELPKYPPSERKPILIMEDDCEFTHDASIRFQEFISGLPRDWEIAFPGGQHFQSAVPFAPGVVRCRETGRTHCVMISASFAAELFCFWLKWDTHVDHGLQHWCKTSGERRFFAADPFFAIQGANWSTIRWRQEPARSWDGRVPALHRKPADVPIIVLTEPKHIVQKWREQGKVHTGYWRDDQDIDRGLVEIMRKDSHDRPAEFKKWIALLRSETAAFPEAALGIWWPDDPIGIQCLLSQSGTP